MTEFKNVIKRGAVCRTRALLLWCLTAVTVLPIAAHAASGSGSVAFSRGSSRLAIHGGGATAFDQNYSVFGIGGGYFVADGIEAGIDAETWSGNAPRITRVSPQLRIVLNTSSSFNPYAGVFYQKMFIANRHDNDSVGGRAGLLYAAGRNAYFGAGVVYESHLSCDRTVYTSCNEIYPELSFTLIF